MIVMPVSLETRAERSALLEEQPRQRGIELVDDVDLAETVRDRVVSGSKLSPAMARGFDSLCSPLRFFESKAGIGALPREPTKPCP